MAVIVSVASWQLRRTPAIARLIVLNNSVLFACVSMYLGTGWSLVLFSFSIADQLTPDNYYLQFVPQITAAVPFFTHLFTLMMVLNLVMIVAEWGRPLRWLPVALLVAILAPAILTSAIIFPLNDLLASRITDPVELKNVLGRWILLSEVRVGLWTVQWVLMMIYFAIKAIPAEEMS
jgi:hypothetical protein